jgi:hypothetical protein
MAGGDDDGACGLVCSAPGSPGPDVSAAAAADLLSHSSVCGSARGALVVFDWDDTLLPSSWLSSAGLRLDSPEELPAAALAQLAASDEAAAALVQSALRCAARVCIITNADDAWVARSSARFAPRVSKMLPQCSVVSARSAFEALAPGDFIRWKAMAFSKVIGECYASSVVSIGDSLVERDAVHAAAAEHPDIVVKSIKLIEKPHPVRLVEQLDMLRSCIDALAADSAHCDLMIRIAE